MYVYWTTCILSVGLPASILEKGWYISLQQYSCILGLQSSWGTSRARPAWSPSGHVLTPALSSFRGTHARSHAPPEEVVYSLNDSCPHFTNAFPSNCPLLPYWPSYFNTEQCTHTYHTLHSHPHISYYVTYIKWRVHVYLASSFLPHYVAGWLLSIHCVRYK